MNGMARSVDWFVRIRVADELPRRFTGKPAARIGCRHFIPASGHADNVLGLRFGQRKFENAIGRGLTIADRLLIQ